MATDATEFKWSNRKNGNPTYVLEKTVKGKKYTVTIMDTDKDGCFDAHDSMKFSDGAASIFNAEDIKKAVLKGTKPNDDSKKGYDETDSNRSGKTDNSVKEMPKIEKDKDGKYQIKAEANTEYTLESFMNYDKSAEAQKDKPADGANKTPENGGNNKDASSSAPETQVFDPRVLMYEPPSPMQDPNFGLMLSQVQTNSYSDSMLMGASDFGGFCGTFGGGFGGFGGFGAPMMMPMGGLFGGLLGGMCGGIFGGLFGGHGGFSRGFGAGFLGGMLGGLFGGMFNTPSYSYTQASYQQGGYPQQYHAPQEQYYTPIPEQQAPAATATQQTASPAAKTTTPAPATGTSATGSTNASTAANAVAPAAGAAPTPAVNAASATTPTGEAKPQEGTIKDLKAKRDEYSAKTNELGKKDTTADGSMYSKHMQYLLILDKAIAEVEGLDPKSENYKKRIDKLTQDVNRAMEILDAQIQKKPIPPAGTSAPAAAGATPAATSSATTAPVTDAVDSTKPFKAGQARNVEIGQIKATYVLSDIPEKNQGYNFAIKAASVNDDALVDFVTSKQPAASDVKANKKDSEIFIIQNAAFQDLTVHANSGEKLPYCATSFMKEHKEQAAKLGLELDASGKILTTKAGATAPTAAPATTSVPDVDSCAGGGSDPTASTDGISVDGNSMSQAATAPVKAQNYTAQIMAFKDRALNGKEGDDFAALVKEIVEFGNNTPNLSEGNKADLKVAEKMAIARRDAKSAPAPVPASAKEPQDMFMDPKIMDTIRLENQKKHAKEINAQIKEFSAQIKKASKDLVELQKIGIAISAYHADNENNLSKGQQEALDKLRNQINVLIEKAPQKPIEVEKPAVKPEPTPAPAAAAPAPVKAEPPMSAVEKLMQDAHGNSEEPKTEAKPVAAKATTEAPKPTVELPREELTKRLKQLSMSSYLEKDPAKLKEVLAEAENIRASYKNLTPGDIAMLDRTIALAKTPNKMAINSGTQDNSSGLKQRVFAFANKKEIPEDTASKIAELEKAKGYVAELKELSKNQRNNIASIKGPLMAKTLAIYNSLPSGTREQWMNDMLRDLYTTY